MRAFRFLLALAESEPPVAAASIVVEEIGDELAVANALGLLVPGNNRAGVTAGPGDAELRPILAFDGSAGAVTCFHPDAGFVTVSTETLRTWRLDTVKLAAFIGRLLGQPASFRPATLVDGLLWELGTPRLGRAGIPVLFARRLTDEAARYRIRHELELRLGEKLSLLLTSDRRVAIDLVLPAVSAVVPVVESLDRTADAARLDFPRLATLAGQRQAAAPSRPDLPVDCEADGHWLKIHGKTYTFRGTQARIIRRLYEAWATGQEWVRVQDVLEVVESRSTKIAEAFKGKKEWKDVIEVAGGNCRLRVPQANEAYSVVPGFAGFGVASLA